MTSIRIFFAIDLTLEIKSSIANIMSELQKLHKNRAIRWSKPHHLHITLQFLAAIKAKDLEKLLTHVRKEIASFPSFELEIGDLELFPTQYHPRIISLKIGPQEILADLAEKIGRGILASDYGIEARPFRGHLTLARLNRIDKQFKLAEIILPTFEKIHVNEIILYRSEPAREGPNYSILQKLALCNNFK